LEVVGKEKKKRGWIKSKNVSYTDEDIAVGLLANKALALKDSFKMNEKIEAIVTNPSFSKSVFINHLKTLLEKSQN